MRLIALLFCVTWLAGCSTPNSNPRATAVVYEQFEQGIKNNEIYSRQQVYTLLGQPYSVKPPGDIDHCQTATWKIPHDVSGWGHLTVNFSNDIAVGYDTHQMVARVYKGVSLDDVLKMQPFEATVEEVRIEHSWFFKPDVYIDLKRDDNATRLAITILGTNEAGLKFADQFHQGSSYEFPKVITDFLNAQNVQTAR
jgi:hypothetical protein